MLRANGEGVPVGGESELRAGVAIVGADPAGALAAAIVRQQTSDLGVLLIIEKRVGPKPLAGGVLFPEGAQILREVGINERVEQSTFTEALIEHASTLGSTVLAGITVERVQTSVDRIERLHLDDGRAVVADWYIDASGPARVLAQAVGASTEKISGENWLLCGTTAGTSEPVHVVDLSMALTTGRDAGCTVAALHRGGHDAQWLLKSYCELTRIHLEHFARLARSRHASDPQLELRRYNIIKPNLVGVKHDWIAEFRGGEVHRVPCYVRDGRSLPVSGVYEHLLTALKHHTVIADVLTELEQQIRETEPPDQQQAAIDRCIDGLEVMLLDGWLIGRLDRRRPLPEWPADTPPHVRVLGSDDRTKAAAVEPRQRAIG